MEIGKTYVISGDPKGVFLWARQAIEGGVQFGTMEPDLYGLGGTVYTERLMMGLSKAEFERFVLVGQGKDPDDPKT